MSSWWRRVKDRLVPEQYIRALTPGEKQLGRDTFGDSIDLDRVRVHAAPWIIRGYALSPNGHIYFNPKDWRQDFSTATLSEKSWLIHELTHVWQVQRGVAVVRKALMDRRYHYNLEPKKRFMEYGIEQQAQMVQDWFMAKHAGRDCTAYESCVPFLNEQARSDTQQT